MLVVNADRARAGGCDPKQAAGDDQALDEMERLVAITDHKPPFLAVWGKNDPFFLPPGAEAFKRDIPAAVVRFFDTGHFALETHAAEIVAAIRKFLTRHT
jgi:pimeloyl-ACP methyl ester carboxylesterase